jgi:hypothetical protein
MGHDLFLRPGRRHTHEHQAALGYQDLHHIPVRLQQLIHGRKALSDGGLKGTLYVCEGPNAQSADEAGE